MLRRPPRSTRTAIHFPYPPLLRSWLPDSFPTAPAPVTAVFAGLLTKVGVYAILRVQVLLFPDSPLSNLLLWAALLTMVIGILGAIAQSDIKRMLSFKIGRAHV